MDNTDIQKIKNENTLLRKEQETLFEQLKSLNQKLEESDSFKSHFLSNISNEIVNPFTSILGISQNIQKLDKSDIEQIHSMANLIYNEAFDLDFQLRNIFAAAKIESGENKLELVNIQIPDFFNEIINGLRLKAEKRALIFEFTHLFSTERFNTDADKLRMILINLIMNAISFSTEKNKISMYAELNDAGLQFKIHNQGKPIEAKNAKIIFDRFLKLDNSIHSLNLGHGLGLSIIKDYAEILGGSVSFESNEGSGTTFTVSLPPIENQELFMKDEDLFSSDDSELF